MLAWRLAHLAEIQERLAATASWIVMNPPREIAAAG